MSEESLKQRGGRDRGLVPCVNLTIEEARDLAKRALAFKRERGRLPSITSPDAWEKRMAEGVAFPPADESRRPRAAGGLHRQRTTRSWKSSASKRSTERRSERGPRARSG